MTGETGRPQDQGRRHRAKPAPSAATVGLLADYHAAMRSELGGLLVEIAGKPAPAGLMPDVDPGVIRPSLTDRGKLWDLAVKLARELAGEIDVAPTAAAAPKPARRRRPDFG